MTDKHGYETLIFDLDGTLSDPKQGFVNCINFALKQYGFEPYNQADLLDYIGPPLDQTFQQLIKSNASDLLEKLIVAYRAQYSIIGSQQNVLYTDMDKILKQISQNGTQKMGVCTAKKYEFAIKILEKYDILSLFEFVSGGEIGKNKGQQLDALLKDNIINKNAIMIGDRNVDMIAAHENGLDCAGVLWGYGSKAELSHYKPNHLFKMPQQLLSLI